MDYVILLFTLLVYFCGLLFLVNQFPTPAFRTFIEVMCIILIIASLIVTFAMILWDYNTRKKKYNKLKRKERMDIGRQIIELKRQKKDYTHLQRRLQKLKTTYDEDQNVKFTPPLFWDIRESEDEKMETFQEIMNSLFSITRIKRKIFLIRRKNKRIQTRIKKSASVVRRRLSVRMTANQLPNFNEVAKHANK